jgi:Autophagy protein 16 (ATG16)
LATGISLTVLEERTAKLEEENRSLLERWLAKIKAEVETMNDANEFLERIRGMRMSSPTSAYDTPVVEKEED